MCGSYHDTELCDCLAIEKIGNALSELPVAADASAGSSEGGKMEMRQKDRLAVSLLVSGSLPQLA